MEEVRCPHCGMLLARRLLGSVEIFCRRCRRIITIRTTEAA
jgi:phage FluMu protein Com